MPSFVRAVGLGLLLFVRPAWLAAQAPRPSAEPPYPSGSVNGMGSRPWMGRVGTWPEAGTPYGSGGVVQADFRFEAADANGLPQGNRHDHPSTYGDAHAKVDGQEARPLDLPSRGSSLTSPSEAEGSRASRKGRTSSLPSVVTIASSLAVVLGLFLVVAWTMRQAVPGGSAALPREVVENLGRMALPGRQQLHLLRCGSKLLLVSVTPTGVETLTEITDPDEVGRLAGLCHEAHPSSATATFRQMYHQLARQRREEADV